MKALVWVITGFSYGLIVTLLKNSGITLGGIPTVVLLVVLGYIARSITNKIGSNSFDKKAAQAGMAPAEYAKKDIPKVFLNEIEDRIRTNNGLSEYLDMCVKEKIITKEQADAILNEAK